MTEPVVPGEKRPESQQIACARIALRMHGGPMQDESNCACEHCVALRELIDLVRARPALPAPEPPEAIQDLWNGDWVPNVEQRRWIRQALDVLDRGGGLAVSGGAALPAEPATPHGENCRCECYKRGFEDA